MVRLKEFSEYSEIINTDVSIPYGAIKRRGPVTSMPNFSVSIPYGAIKRKKDTRKLIAVSGFNSLWCD